MFKFAESVPAVFPAKTAFLRGTVGPVVWAESPMLHDVNPANGGVMIALNALEAWEFVKVALRLLPEERKAELVTLLDAVPRENALAALEGARTETESLREELEQARAERLEVVPLAQVIDLVAEREKRQRPKVTTGPAESA